jgi:hypothetical protein
MVPSTSRLPANSFELNGEASNNSGHFCEWTYAAEQKSIHDVPVGVPVDRATPCSRRLRTSAHKALSAPGTWRRESPWRDMND